RCPRVTWETPYHSSVGEPNHTREGGQRRHHQLHHLTAIRQSLRVAVRRRAAADEPRCLALLREVHARDGYPTHWPMNPQRFLAPPQQMTAWVWSQAGNVEGHVALHANDYLPSIDLANAGLNPDQVGICARLLVAPTARRQGIGGQLLAHAAAEA